MTTTPFTQQEREAVQKATALIAGWATSRLNDPSWAQSCWKCWCELERLTMADKAKGNNHDN